jgi:hypothetical protein
MLALPYLPEQPHNEYRDYRQYLLHVYCEGAILQFPEAREILGIAFEHYDSGIVSVDFLYIRLNGARFDCVDRAKIEARLREEGIWAPSEVSGRVIRDVEFPFGLYVLRYPARYNIPRIIKTNCVFSQRKYWTAIRGHW